MPLDCENTDLRPRDEVLIRARVADTLTNDAGLVPVVPLDRDGEAQGGTILVPSRVTKLARRGDRGAQQQ